MKALDAKLLSQFIKKAADKVEGEWLLVGGTLLPAVGLDVRATMDIDLVSLSKRDNEGGLQLMKLADALGLSVETINQSAQFFVNQLQFTKKDLKVLKKGKKATIYRPSLELYWKLKCGRLSESDLTDCLHYLRFCEDQNELKSLAPLKTFIKKQIINSSNPAKDKRLKRLLTSIEK